MSKEVDKKLQEQIDSANAALIGAQTMFANLPGVKVWKGPARKDGNIVYVMVISGAVPVEKDGFLILYPAELAETETQDKPIEDATK